MTSRSPVLERARAALARQLIAILDLEAETRRGEDDEALHDMRVASRRLRAAVAAFAPIFPRRRLRRAWRAVRALTRALGAAREWDVHAAGVRKLVARAEGAEEGEALERVLARVEERRASERAALAAALDAADLTALSLDLVRLAGRARARSRDMAALAAEVIPERVGEALGGIEADRATDDAERLHRRRIAVKKLRYALEALEDAFPDAARRARDDVHARAKKIQDALGKHHDRVLLARVIEGERDALRARGEARLADALGPAIERVRADERRWLDEFVALTEGWTREGTLGALGYSAPRP